MKLKYNHGGEIREIPLTTDKPQGKRLAVRKNGQTWYAPLVSVTDSTASNFRLVFGGEVCALAEAPTLQPEIENILIAPPRVSVMQGQSATATVSAEGNEAVAGLSYSLTNPPTWITISDDMILIRPSDNDLGEAIVEVLAKDTGSDASASAAFVAEARLRPIIESLSVIPPAVTVSQGSTSTAIVQAVANSAVGGLSYSLDGAPSWVSLDQDTIHIEPTTNDTGTANVQVVAYDPNSSARADTSFTAEAVIVPQIYGVTASPSTVTVEQGDSTVVTLAAEYNSAVTSIEYSMEGAPPWMTISGNLITVAPTTSDLGSVTVTVIARDTDSGVQANTQLTAEVQVKALIDYISSNIRYLCVNSFAENDPWVTAFTPSGGPIDHTVVSARFTPSAQSLRIDQPERVWPAHYIYIKLTNSSYVGRTGTLSLTLEETTGAVSTHDLSLPIQSPTVPTVSLNPAQATLQTGTSGNQSVTLKAAISNKKASYWRVVGYFPKNSTITPGVGFTSKSSVASLKVVYPKASQTRTTGTVATTFYYIPSDADIASASSSVIWQSLSSSNGMYYYYNGDL